MASDTQQSSIIERIRDTAEATDALVQRALKADTADATEANARAAEKLSEVLLRYAQTIKTLQAPARP